MCLFFFFKQKTAYEMRISDWSSDVCSSDLEHPRLAPRVGEPEQEGEHGEQNQPFQSGFVKLAGMAGETIMASGEHNRPGHVGGLSPKPIGRASCRERVCQYV